MIAPQIGRIVWYRSRTGAYTVPAVITATQATLHAGAVEAGYIPALSSPTHVHLTVLSPGIPQTGPNDQTAYAPKLPPGSLIPSHNLAGTYQEWDVPFFDPASAGKVTVPDPRGGVMQGTVPVSCAPRPDEYELEQLAGTWTWPERS